MKMIPFLVMGIVVLNSCEGEIDDLGSQLVEGADAYDKAYSVIAYNIDNGNFLRSDASKLDSVRIGAFSEDVFGTQKVSYLTQVRLNAYDPDFGTNPVLDSVVLTLKPRYATDSVTTTTSEDYIYPDGSVAAKKVVTTYPVKKYGKNKIGGVKTPLTIKINEVADFLGGTSDSIMSNKAFALGAEIGSKAFDGTVNSVVITKDSDATELLNRAVSFRMKLDSAFFQNKIIAKKGNQVLKDAASFIRYFRGISISVDQNDGYLFSMAPNDAKLVMYYKNDVKATDGTVTRTKAETELSLGSSNVHFSQINNIRPADYQTEMLSAFSVNDLKNVDKEVLPNNYATKLYPQGMGGAGFGIKIPAETVSKLREIYKNQKIGIVSAKIRLYNDDVSWKNSYRKPNSLLVQQRFATGFLTDMTSLAATGYSLIKTANLNTENAYYDIGVTQTLKNIVESETEPKDLIVNVGSYLVDSSTGALYGQNYNDRAYSPYRIVLKGTDKDMIGKEIKDSKAAQLRLIYTKK